MTYNIPYTFVAGTRAKASQVNADFAALVDGLNELSDIKAGINGDAGQNFSVMDPVLDQHATTKRYVDLLVAQSGGSGGGSGTGKSVFEVFHTLTTKTPPGAFSLRNGDIIPNVSTDYPGFTNALEEQSRTLIEDFTNIAPGAEPADYTMTLTNVVYNSSTTNGLNAFTSYGWLTSNNKPTDQNPIVAQLDFVTAIKTPYFKINCHTFKTYFAPGNGDPSTGIKTAIISIKSGSQWFTAATIAESELPTTVERYYENHYPDLEFSAMRIVISENFGANKTDVSLYPVDPELTTIRVVSDEQWQWEVDNFGETGAFVYDEGQDIVRLPKINRFLTGAYELYEVGIPHAETVSKSGLAWKDGDGGSGGSGDSGEESNALVSLNSVSTGLWIQAYNAVSEDVYANVRYIPHGTLFEEQPFRFVPDELTGWYVSDGSWRDGNYFTSAMTFLLNMYAKAEQVEGKPYKLAPNGMRFASESDYNTAWTNNQDSPYYVLDSANYRFKTPRSKNYIRLTDQPSQAGEFLQDAAPNITGSVPGTEQNQMKGVSYNSPEGCFYTKGANVTNGSSANDAWDNDVFGFDASRSSAVYGRANEVRPKSHYEVLCVFLGNEVPTSASVNIMTRVYDHEQRIETLEQSGAADIADLQNQVDDLDTAVAAHAQSIQELQYNTREALDQCSNLQADVTQIQTDIESLQSDVETNASNIRNVQAQLVAHDNTLNQHAQQISTNTSNITANATEISLAQSELSTLSSTVSGHTTSIANNASAISQAQNDISSLSSAQTTMSSDIQTNASNISSNHSDIVALQTAVGGNTSDISSLQSALDALTLRVEALENQNNP